MDWREKPLRRFPTTAEISARAGVDKSTVSRALKNDPRVKEIDAANDPLHCRYARLRTERHRA